MKDMLLQCISNKSMYFFCACIYSLTSCLNSKSTVGKVLRTLVPKIAHHIKCEENFKLFLIVFNIDGLMQTKCNSTGNIPELHSFALSHPNVDYNVMTCS